MKNTISIILLGFALLFISSCGKNGLAGQVTFWTDSNLNCGEITVILDGDTIGKITEVYSEKPFCNKVGTASKTIANGTYNYTASDTCNVWSGTVTLSENACYTEKIN
ncbi:MAG: hypothetical protein ACPGVH_05515 [Chitinophagales bacterium]